MNRAPVKDSSMFLEVGYSPETKVLEVKFKSNGAVYAYDGVTLGDWREWCAAESKGSHFSKHIRGRFPSRKIEQEETPDGENEGQET
jgi:KTSC domain